MALTNEERAERISDKSTQHLSDEQWKQHKNAVQNKEFGESKQRASLKKEKRVHDIEFVPKRNGSLTRVAEQKVTLPPSLDKRYPSDVPEGSHIVIPLRAAGSKDYLHSNIQNSLNPHNLNFVEDSKKWIQRNPEDMALEGGHENPSEPDDTIHSKYRVTNLNDNIQNAEDVKPSDRLPGQQYFTIKDKNLENTEKYEPSRYNINIEAETFTPENFKNTNKPAFTMSAPDKSGKYRTLTSKDLIENKYLTKPMSVTDYTLDTENIQNSEDSNKSVELSKLSDRIDAFLEGTDEQMKKADDFKYNPNLKRFSPEWKAQEKELWKRQRQELEDGGPVPSTGNKYVNEVKPGDIVKNSIIKSIDAFISKEEDEYDPSKDPNYDPTPLRSYHQYDYSGNDLFNPDEHVMPEDRSADAPRIKKDSPQPWGNQKGKYQSIEDMERNAALETDPDFEEVPYKDKAGDWKERQQDREMFGKSKKRPLLSAWGGSHQERNAEKVKPKYDEKTDWKKFTGGRAAEYGGKKVKKSEESRAKNPNRPVRVGVISPSRYADVDNVSYGGKTEELDYSDVPEGRTGAQSWKNVRDAQLGKLKSMGATHYVGEAPDFTYSGKIPKSGKVKIDRESGMNNVRGEKNYEMDDPKYMNPEAIERYSKLAGDTAQLSQKSYIIKSIDAFLNK